MALSFGIGIALAGMLLLSFSKVVEKKIVDAAQLFNGAFHIYLARTICLGIIVFLTKSFKIPPNIPYYMLTIVIGAVSILALYVAFQQRGIGLPSAIAGSFVPITIALSILFYHESFSQRVWAGVVLVLVGIFLASFDFRSLRKLRLLKGSRYALITLVGWGFFFFLIKGVVVPMGPIPATFFLEGGIFAVIALFSLCKNAVRQTTGRVWKLAVLSGILSSAGLLLYYGSIVFIGAALAATLLQVGVVVSAILGAFFFKEQFDTTKKIAILITFIGLLLVTL